MLNSFQGLDTTISTLQPPDTHLAVGPGHVVEVVNNSIAIFHKGTGAQLSSQLLGDFFAPVVPLSGGTIFDPVVIFDELAERFVVMALEGKRRCRQQRPVRGLRHVQSDGRTGWMVTATRSPRCTGSRSIRRCSRDFPRIGWNADAHVVTFNMFDGSAPPTSSSAPTC